MTDLRDRFVGCLLGQAVADAVCAPFEGVPGDVIWYDFGGARRILNNPPVETLQYTDDTQMTLALADELAEYGFVDEESLALRYGDYYDPLRGYGPGARQVLEAIRAGRDWRSLRTSIFPNGSLGNGAAMRAAPIGLLFHRDRGRLIEEADRSARPTHVHPVGIDGARVIAAAVAHVMREPILDMNAFYDDLLGVVHTEEFSERLDAARLLGPDDSVARFGSDLQAHRSVVTAVACFTLNADSYVGAVAQALSLGGDVDTVAAMAGAIAGARLGSAAIPRHLSDRLEDGFRGRAYIIELANRLYDRLQAADDVRPRGTERA